MSFLSVPISIFGTRPTRIFGTIELNVVISESTNDTLTITKQPVQTGASITDHAYKEPTTFNFEALFKDNIEKSLSKTYEELLTLQNSRVPFTITTPKRIYNNMLISSIGQTTDKTSENILKLMISCQEVILVRVSTTQVPRTKQRNPGATGKTENVGKKSALSVAAGAIRGLVP